MKNKTKLCFFWALGFIACNKLRFEGNTFQTVKGFITDTLNKPIPNLDVNMVAAINQNPMQWTAKSGPVTVSSTVTKNDGSFQFTFPQSNGYLYVLLPKNYIVADSLKSLSDQKNQIYIDTAKFQHLLYNVSNIKIIKQ